MPRERQETLGRVLTRRVGFRNAGRVLGVVSAWAFYVDKFGRAPTQTELQGETARSHASWSRDLAIFARAFPDEESPDRIARLLLARLRSDRKVGLEVAVAGAWSVPFSVVAL